MNRIEGLFTIPLILWLLGSSCMGQTATTKPARDLFMLAADSQVVVNKFGGLVEFFGVPISVKRDFDSLRKQGKCDKLVGNADIICTGVFAEFGGKRLGPWTVRYTFRKDRIVSTWLRLDKKAPLGPAKAFLQKLLSDALIVEDIDPDWPATKLSLQSRLLFRGWPFPVECHAIFEEKMMDGRQIASGVHSFWLKYPAKGSTVKRPGSAQAKQRQVQPAKRTLGGIPVGIGLGLGDLKKGKHWRLDCEGEVLIHMSGAKLKVSENELKVTRLVHTFKAGVNAGDGYQTVATILAVDGNDPKELVTAYHSLWNACHWGKAKKFVDVDTRKESLEGFFGESTHRMEIFLSLIPPLPKKSKGAVLADGYPPDVGSLMICVPAVPAQRNVK